ncbi:MAG: hypothetical protein DSY82_01460 [Flavobacteriia bacterium]|nr:MAG: hypothetical protein DSY82_01460 [Flavobacteriia bacterium]
MLSLSVFSQDNPLVNVPSLNSTGTRIAFNYQGDIWVANTNGTNIKRLTVHEAYDTNPLWSDDDRFISS